MEPQTAAVAIAPPDYTRQQRYAIFACLKKGYDAPYIQYLLKELFGERVLSVRSIQRWMRMFRNGRDSLENGNKNNTNRRFIAFREQSVTAIATALQTDHHLSSNRVAALTDVSLATVCKYRRRYLGQRYARFLRTPHMLNNNQMQNRVLLAHEMLDWLERYPYLLTQDESWIFLTTPGYAGWLNEDEATPERPTVKLGAKKAMLSVIWSRDGIKYLFWLPQGETFKKETFALNLSSLRALISDSRKIPLHCDNARPHLVNFSDLGYVRVPHPAYSPDLAPSDFFLFGVLKQKLAGTVFSTIDQMKLATMQVLANIPVQHLENAYQGWVRRLRVCIASGGKYYQDKPTNVV